MNFHILTQSKERDTINVVFHIPITTSLNAVGISWRDAVVKELGTVTSVLTDIDPAEMALLESGALVEKVENVRFSSLFITNNQRLQEIKDRYTALETQLYEEKQITLDFMGYEGDV